MPATNFNPRKQLDRIIRANYPVVIINSFEEERVEREVQAVVKDRKRSFYVWSLSRGLNFVDGQRPDNAPQPDETQDAAAALSAVAKWGGKDIWRNQNPQQTVFLFKDLHRIAEGELMVLRLLRDIVKEFQSCGNTLVLLSPEFKVPADLSKDVVALDWPLPDGEKLREILDNCIDSLPAQSSAGGKIKRSVGEALKDKIIAALGGLTQFEAASVLSIAVVANQGLDEDAIPFIVAEKRDIIKRAGYLEFFDTDKSFSDVGGLDVLKRYVSMRLSAFGREAEMYGIDSPRGVLIYGVPGTGKSLIAKACTAGQVPLLRMDVGALLGGLVGSSQANTRAALKVADAAGRCVLWIDEVEKGLAGASGSGMNDGGTMRQVFGTILTWMQEHKSPVYVVATANDIGSLPPEFLRRFDTIFFCDLPVDSERVEILSIHLSKRRREPRKFDLKAIAEATDGFTGAEIEKVVATALLAGWDDGAREITTEDLLTAASDVVPISRTMGEKIAAMREWANNRAQFASKRQAESVAANVREASRKLDL